MCVDVQVSQGPKVTVMEKMAYSEFTDDDKPATSWNDEIHCCYCAMCVFTLSNYNGRVLALAVIIASDRTGALGMLVPHSTSLVIM